MFLYSANILRTPISCYLMIRWVAVTGFLLLGLLPCTAQKEQARSIHELKSLLTKAGNDTNRISLLLETSMAYVLRPGSFTADMDTSLYFANQAYNLARIVKRKSWEGKCLYVYSHIYREQNNTEKGNATIKQAIALLAKYGKKRDLGDAYVELANYCSWYDSVEAKKKVLYDEKAARLFNEAGEKKKYSEVLYTLSDLYLLAGKTTMAADTIRKFLAIYKQLNNPNVQYAYDLLGSIYRTTGDYKQALSYAYLAVQTAEAVKDTTFSLCTIYNRLGLKYYDMKQYSEATRYFKKSLPIAIKYYDTASVYMVALNQMHSCYLDHKPEEAVKLLKFVEKEYPFGAIAKDGFDVGFVSTAVRCYVKLNDQQQAHLYQQKLLKITAGFSPSNPLTRVVYNSLISYYLSTKEYKEANKYCILIDTYFKHQANYSDLGDNYLWWSTADSALGNYPAALAHYKMYKAIKDSVFNETKTKQIAQIEIQYQTAEKEKNIQLLTQKTELQQTQLRQTQLTRNVILGGSIMLIVLLGLGYNRYRLKQRSNSQLEAKQKEINLKNESLNHLLEEKEWLIKEIHHRVKNNLQIVMSLLNTQSQYLDNNAAIKAIDESRHRMHAMSLIHQRLYQTENVATVNMPTYISELISYLRDSYDTNLHTRFIQNIDDINLDVAQAIPIGLILNEAITNAVKYAFPNNIAGTVNITMKKSVTNTIRLQITDDGIGLPVGYSIDNSSSLGMSLMKGLTKQLGGTFVMKTNKGLEIEIEFPYINGVHVV